MSTTSEYQSNTLNRNSILKDRAIQSVVLGGMLAGLPFLPTPLSIAIGAVCGTLCASLLSRIQDESRPIEQDLNYESLAIEDAGIVSKTYFGNALPFIEWKNALSKITVEHGIGLADQRRALAAEMYPRMRPFFLDDDLFTRHVAVMAGTGSFKSEFVKNIVAQQIRKGGGFILVEAKRDINLTGEIYAMYRDARELDKLKVINFEDPKNSHSYNPVIYGDNRATISTTMRIQAKSKEEFWKDIARYALSAAIIVLRAQPNPKPICISDIAAVLKDLDEMRDLASNINIKQSPEHERDKQHVIAFLDNWYDDAEGDWNRKSFKTQMNGVISKLSTFTHSEYSSIVNTYNPDIDLKRAIQQGHGVILTMSALKDKEGVEQFSRFFIADLMRAIGEIQSEGGKPALVFPVMFDEYGSFADETHQELLQLARSALIPILMLMQSRGFLDIIGKEFGSNLLSQAWHHIYGDVRDKETREYAASLSTTILNRLEQSNESNSSSSGHESASSGLVTNDNIGHSKTHGFKQQRETLIQPNDFMDLDQGDAIIVGKSGTYKVRIPIVQVSNPPKSWNDMELVYENIPKASGLNLWQKYTRATAQKLNIDY